MSELMVKAELTWIKSTKNTHVYNAVDDSSDSIIPTLYIKKGALPVPVPLHITITITEGHE